MNKRQSRRLYLLFVGVLVANLATSVYFVDATLELRASDGEVINAAGRQRMLSQRLLAYALVADADPRDAAAQGELAAVVAEWRAAHAELLDLGTTVYGDAEAEGWPADLRALTPTVDRVTQLLDGFRGGNAAAVRMIRRETEYFLLRMNEVVGVMAADSTRALRRTQHWGVAFTLATVGLAAVLIFGFLLPEQRRSERLVGEVTDQRDLLERRFGELERANERLNLFMQVASHDMKTPLRSIGSFANLIERRYKKDLDPEAGEYFGYIKEGARGMTRVLDDLVAYNQAGGVRETYAVDLDAVLHAVRIDLHADLRESGAQLHAEPLGQIVASREVASQLLQNLIRNAIVNRDRSRPCIVRVARRGNCLTVEDNGVGLPDEYREKVFEPFKRVGDASRPGSGMGLSICRALVRSIGGDIDYRGREGVGTIFTVTFAEDAAEAVPQGDRESAPVARLT